MKKLTLSVLTLLLISVTTSQAQMVMRGSENQSFNQLMESKLNIVLLGNASYDQSIQAAVNEYWTATSYEFISISKLEERISDESFSFLVPLTGDFHWVAIVNGGKKSVKHYSDDDAIAIAPLAKWSEERDLPAISYRMDYIVKGLNDALLMVKSKNLNSSAIGMPKLVCAETNKKLQGRLQDRTLLINKDTRLYDKETRMDKAVIDVKNLEKSGVTFKYKLVSDKEFKAALSNNSTEYLCLMPISEANQHILIYDPATRETVYYEWKMTGLEVGKSSYQDIQATAGIK